MHVSLDCIAQWMVAEDAVCVWVFVCHNQA
jgi:hypothetical protein